ncbi:MAG TPA: hypothetical protein PLP29_07795 [Candidatus Ozemobacteraceae bacterium]|nr:hypothetical protein [Candidatus Ozemobacteraceae bacterium]
MQLKRFSLWILCLGLIASALAGCGGGGGGGGSSLPSMNTTIAGSLEPPDVTTPGVAGSVRGLTGLELLPKYAASGTCTVNGQAMAFSLATATKHFQIPDIPTASFYDVKFTYKNLVLRTIVPHTSPYMSTPVNVDSTVKAWIMERYAFTPTQMANWEIKSTYVTYMASRFQAWLKDLGSSLSGFQNRWTAELASLSYNVPTIASLASDLTPAVDLRGTWRGTNCVFYNLNFNGQRATKLTGDLILKVTGQSGNAVTGTLAITVRNQEKMPNVDNMIPEPNYPASTFTSGNISSTKFTFVYGYNKFEFETLSDSMLGKVSNCDQKFAGLDSDAGAFLLTKEW